MVINNGFLQVVDGDGRPVAPARPDVHWVTMPTATTDGMVFPHIGDVPPYDNGLPSGWLPQPGYDWWPAREFVEHQFVEHHHLYPGPKERKPHKCPVCDGRGKVVEDITAKRLKRIKCGACKQGVVWDD